MQPEPQIGDLVKMKRGYSEPGLFIEFVMTKDWVKTGEFRWVRVLWPDHGLGMEKLRDLKVINESR
jgi:hypothetical protein